MQRKKRESVQLGQRTDDEVGNTSASPRTLIHAALKKLLEGAKHLNAQQPMQQATTVSRLSDQHPP